MLLARFAGCALGAVLAIPLSACSIIDPPSVELRADQPNLDQSYVRLVDAVESYLGMQSDLFEQDPQRFFDEGHKLLADIREAQGAWKSDVAAAELDDDAQDGMPSAAAADEFTAAMDAWLSAQEQQARMSEDCWTSYDPQSCYADLLSQYSTAWDAASVRVNAAIERMADEVAE